VSGKNKPPFNIIISVETTTQKEKKRKEKKKNRPNLVFISF